MLDVACAPARRLDEPDSQLGYCCFRTSREKLIAGIKQDADLLRGGCDLLESLRPFSGNLGLEGTESGRVSAWPRQTLNETAANGISNHGEYRWHAPRHSSRGC